jgi:hypothetical protein
LHGAELHGEGDEATGQNRGGALFWAYVSIFMRVHVYRWASSWSLSVFTVLVDSFSFASFFSTATYREGEGESDGEGDGRGLQAEFGDLDF